MLNRRILRVKAMQGLYAYYNSMDANYNLSVDLINENFSNQLLNDHSLDKKEIDRKRRQSVKLFQDAVRKGEFKIQGEPPDEPESLSKEFYDRYVNAVKKDLAYFRKNMISEAERIFDFYLLFLKLPVEVARHEIEEAAEKEDVKTRKKPVEMLNHSGFLKENKIIRRLETDKHLEKICQEKKISWKKYSDAPWDLYKNQVKKDKEYQKYKGTVKRTLEEDRNFCLHFYKNILFKNGMFNDFMESTDINWFEDSEVLRSMVIKTIKSLDEKDQVIEFSSLSKNWPEDREFFRDIFDHTVGHDREYDEIISQKSKNWDITRIALTDRIILKMAIGEMINFPGIPVKVTINEYIELSKNFSTPKSKKFVNGILDVVSAELIEKGVIKKSGRGLIDNQ